MNKNAEGKVRVTLVRSVNGRLKSHKGLCAWLGLRKINHSRVLENTPEVRGMIRKVSYMVDHEIVE